MTLQQARKLKVGDKILFKGSMEGVVFMHSSGEKRIRFKSRTYNQAWNFLGPYARNHLDELEIAEDEADKMFDKLKREVEEEVR